MNKTAIEYKFADHKDKLVGIFDGIHADVKNYANHEIWEHFIAVIYMDAAYESEQHLAKWRSTLPPNWTLLTMVGKSSHSKVKGSSKTKAAASATAAPSPPAGAK